MLSRLMESALWGAQITAGSTVVVEVPTDRGLILTRAALVGYEPGPNVLSVKSGDDEFVLGTMRETTVEQLELDIILSSGSEVSFSMTGQNKIHLTGYYNLAYGEQQSYDESYEYEDDTDEELIEEMSSDYEDFPQPTKPKQTTTQTAIVKEVLAISAVKEKQPAPAAPAVKEQQAPKKRAGATELPEEEGPPAKKQKTDAKPAAKSAGKPAGKPAKAAAKPAAAKPAAAKPAAAKPAAAKPTPPKKEKTTPEKPASEKTTPASTPGNFACEPCKKTFKTETALTQHKTQKHSTK
jgi:hypothetical protein